MRRVEGSQIMPPGAVIHHRSTLTSLVHSHWSSNVEAWLSLVEIFSCCCYATFLMPLRTNSRHRHGGHFVASMHGKVLLEAPCRGHFACLELWHKRAATPRTSGVDHSDCDNLTQIITFTPSGCLSGTPTSFSCGSRTLSSRPRRSTCSPGSAFPLCLLYSTSGTGATISPALGRITSSDKQFTPI